MQKRKIYFFESNIPMDGVVYLPLVSGLLQAYAQSFPEIKELYSFEKYIFMRDTPENMIKNVVDPFMMCFSVCIWNEQLSLAVAQLIKQRFPQCILLFGGPQVTKSYLDLGEIIEEEGEKKFVNLLAKLAGKEINVSQDNLNNYPSPYVLGLFDSYFIDYPHMTFQAIVETNRGCPFTCSFCYWGQGFEEKKVRHHSLEYVKEEAEWIGRNKIKYIFMADANFGMYDRDYEVAKIYCQTKEKYGYPEKIRVCYGKNKEENVFKTACLLHDQGLGKSVTLARQSNNNVALEAIKRSNIKLSVYDNLSKRYSDRGISTYTELILGLPGETKETFKKAVEEISNTPTQLFVYHCTVLPNTDMASPEYIKKYGIKTVRVPLTEIHGEIRKSGYITEYENIIIETNTMSVDDWKECAVYSWATQLRCVFGINDIPSNEIEKFNTIAENVTNGYSRAQIDTRFGNIYWEPEEAAYLRISLSRGEIKGDLKEFAREQVLWGRKSRVNKIKEKVCSD